VFSFIYLLNINRDKLQLIFFLTQRNNSQKETQTAIDMASAGTSSILLQITIDETTLQTEMTEAITKNIPTCIITKTKQATIFIKNKNCFIYQLILAIVFTMVKVHQSSISPP
jgi:microcompartment protein CcmK/EutM